MILRSALIAVAFAACCAASAANALDNGATFSPHRGVGGLRTFGEPIKDSHNPARYGADPYQPRWADYMPRARLDELRGAGFDFLRINIDPGPLFDAKGPEFDNRLNEIKEAVAAALAAGLGAIVDFHFSENHPLWGFRQVTAGFDTLAFKRYVETLQEVAHMLSAFPTNHVALEVFNEPPPPCAWDDRPGWPQQLQEIHSAARRAAPKLTLLVSGACWASIDGLVQLDPADFDANTMFVFHYYQPYVFTAQGYWSAATYLKYVNRLPYPPDPRQCDAFIARVRHDILAARDISANERVEAAADAARQLADYFDNSEGANGIVRDFARVQRWADRNGIPYNRIILGEFGAMKDVYGKKGAAPADRARWLSDVRMAAEKAGFAWSVWALTNTDGIVIGDLDGPLDPSVLQALGLNTKH